MSKKITRLNPVAPHPLFNIKHHLIPSGVGGVAAYVLSGVAIIGIGVFAAVWLGNAISHHLHRK